MAPTGAQHPLPKGWLSIRSPVSTETRSGRGMMPAPGPAPLMPTLSTPACLFGGVSDHVEGQARKAASPPQLARGTQGGFGAVPWCSVSGCCLEGEVCGVRGGGFLQLSQAPWSRLRGHWHPSCPAGCDLGVGGALWSSPAPPHKWAGTGVTHTRVCSASRGHVTFGTHLKRPSQGILSAADGLGASGMGTGPYLGVSGSL